MSTFSIIYLLSQSQNTHCHTTTNSISISMHLWRTTLTMLSSGGYGTTLSILTYCVWLVIILLFQMCIFCFLFIDILNLLFIAMSIDVEYVFSHGRLLLSHIQSCLSTQTTHALLCLGCWSLLGLVKDKDILPITHLPDIEGNEMELEDGWDLIFLS